MTVALHVVTTLIVAFALASEMYWMAYTSRLRALEERVTVLEERVTALDKRATMSIQAMDSGSLAQNTRVIVEALNFAIGNCSSHARVND